MDWTVEALSVLVTGVLFLVIVLVGLSPIASLSITSFSAFGAAGVVFIGAAFALARVQAVNYPPLMWVLPVLPLLVIGVLCKDAVSARRATGQPAHVTAITRPDVEPDLAVPEQAQASPAVSARDGEDATRGLVSSPYVTPNQLAHFAINNPELRPAIARNPLTPESVLEWLAQQGDPAVLSALAARDSFSAA